MKLRALHHIGKISYSIEDELKKYSSLGLQVDNRIYVDNEQKVRIGLVKLGNGVFLELLEPLNESSPIFADSKKGKRFHHLCFNVKSIDSILKDIKKSNECFRLTRKTVSIFDKRKIVFIATKDKDIIELIE